METHLNINQLCNVNISNSFKNYKNNNFINVVPIETIHEGKQIYYIYYDNKISGPYTTNDIVTLYMYKQIETDKKLYISPANGKENWHSIRIPTESVRQLSDDKAIQRAKHYESLNVNIKNKFPALYTNLIERVLTGEIQPINPAPKSIPSEEETNKEGASLMVILRRILGKILLFMIMFVSTLHVLGSVVVGFLIEMVIWQLFQCSTRCNDWITKETSSKKVVFLFASGQIIMVSGLFTSPIVAVYIILSQFDIYDEIQSWMVAYIVWGFTAFIFISSLIYQVFLVGMGCEKEARKLFKIVIKIILYIVGVDFGRLDVGEVLNQDRSFKEVVTGKDIEIVVLMAQPICAALLPAAIAGFIANFVLEQKFELKCKGDITNGDICFESTYGCCEVVSSHNWRNTYVFMGGLASNIVATWAIIRLCGYLLANAYDNFSVHAKRIAK